MKVKSKLVLNIFVILINLLVDQVAKYVVRKELYENEVIHLIKNHFILTKVENTGAFLSAGNNLPSFVRIIVLTVLPIGVLCYGVWALFKHQNLPALMQVGICFLIGGGFGNIIDRVIYGSVTDFFFIDFVIFKTGVFNFADMSIMIGIVLLLVQSFQQRTKSS